jgi:TonB family protein
LTPIREDSADRFKAIASGVCFVLVVALTGCGRDDTPSLPKAQAATNSEVAAAPAAAPATGTVQPSTATAAPEKPKEVSQDVLKWLQMTSDKGDKADKPDKLAKLEKVDAKVDPTRGAPPVLAGPAPIATTQSAPSPVAVSAAAPSNAAAVSLPRSGVTAPAAANSPPTQNAATNVNLSGATALANPPRPAPAEAPALVATAAAPAAPAAPQPTPAAALRLISREQPSFPAEAVRAGIAKGHVKVRLSVATDGSVTHVEVLESASRGGFDRAVIEAAQRWKYAPLAEPSSAIAEFDFHRDE